MDNLESLLSSVISDEGLMKKIKDVVKSRDDDSSSLNDVISLITPKLEQNNESSNTESAAKEIDDHTSSKNILDKSNSISFVNSLSHSISKNAGLLIALKPYLSKERCQMIDNVVKISKITDTLNLI